METQPSKVPEQLQAMAITEATKLLHQLNQEATAEAARFQTTATQIRKCYIPLQDSNTGAPALRCELEALETQLTRHRCWALDVAQATQAIIRDLYKIVVPAGVPLPCERLSEAMTSLWEAKKALRDAQAEHADGTGRGASRKIPFRIFRYLDLGTLETCLEVLWDLGDAILKWAPPKPVQDEQQPETVQDEQQPEKEECSARLLPCEPVRVVATSTNSNVHPQPCSRCAMAAQVHAWKSLQQEHYEQVRCPGCGIRGTQESNAEDAVTSWDQMMDDLAWAKEPRTRKEQAKLRHLEAQIEALTGHNTRLGKRIGALVARVEADARQRRLIESERDTAVKSNEQLMGQAEKDESTIDDLRIQLETWAAAAVGWSGDIEAIKDAAIELEDKIDKHLDAAQRAAPQ